MILRTFHVYADGVLRSSHYTWEQAVHVAQRRNRMARILGIETRYEARR